MTEYPAQTAVIEDDPKRPWKAITSAVTAAAGAFVLWWVADKGAFTFDDFKEAIGAAVLASGVTGVPTFVAKNPKRHRVIDDAGEYRLGNAVLVGFVLVVVLLLLLAVTGNLR